MAVNRPAPSACLHHETQCYWHPFFRALAPLVALGGAAIWFWRAWADAADSPPGAFWSGLGTGVFVALAAAAAAVLYLRTRLEVWIVPDHVRIEFFPFARRVIPRAEMRSARVRSYRPRKDYGGWGVRRSPGAMAFHVGGTRGVEIELENGHKILIGSDRPELLALALQNMAAPVPATSAAVS